MFEQIRALVLRVLRVPPEPEPPFGAPGSVRVFRAGRNYYQLRLVRWGFAQLAAAAGLVASVMFLHYLEREVAATRAELARPAPAQVAPASAPAAPAVAPTDSADVKRAAKLATLERRERDGRRQLVRTLRGWPGWIFLLLRLFEYGAILLFLAQIPFSYAAVRLDFEQHWYVVTDRSLRIRTGLLSLLESTMSFANLQQVEVKQGPLQRLLGLADLHVQSAGGAGDLHAEGAGVSLHAGVFHSVDNAPEIRDLILERLRQFRATGLGDPDEPAHAVPSAAPESSALPAARELLAEARALRAAVAARP